MQKIRGKYTPAKKGQIKVSERKRKRESREKRTAVKKAKDEETNKKRMKLRSPESERKRKKESRKRKAKNSRDHPNWYCRYYGYSSTPEFSSISRWRPDTYKATNPKWENHPVQMWCSRFCYCWEFGGNRTAYCTCYETWKDRCKIYPKPDCYVFKHQWTITALHDDPIAAEEAKKYLCRNCGERFKWERQRNDHEMRQPWSPPSKFKTILYPCKPGQPKPNEYRFRKGDKGTGNLHSNLNRLVGFQDELSCNSHFKSGLVPLASYRVMSKLVCRVHVVWHGVC